MATVKQRWHRLPLLYLACVLFVAMVAAQAEGTQSISSMSDYNALRPCAKSCFWRTSFNTRTKDELGSALKCQLKTTDFQTITVAMNDCFCRVDLQPSAYQSLSRCVDRYCSSNAYDLSSAGSLYNNYCTANGYIGNGGAKATGAGGSEPTRAQGGKNDPPIRTGGGGGNESSGQRMGPRSAAVAIGLLVVGFMIA